MNKEFLVKLGITFDKSKLDDFQSRLKNIQKSLLDVSQSTSEAFKRTSSSTNSFSLSSDKLYNSLRRLAQFSMGGIFANSVLNIGKTATELQRFSEQAGVSTNLLQRLEIGAQASGLQVNTLSASLVRFNEAIRTKTGAASLQSLGVSLIGGNGARKDSVDLYHEVAIKINALKNATDKASYSQLLFGTRNLTLASYMGQSTNAIKQQIQEASKLGSVLDDKLIKSSIDMYKSWNQMKTLFIGIRNEIAARLTPAFNTIIQSINELVSKNKNVINSITTAFELLHRVINTLIVPIQNVAQALGGWENVFQLLIASKVIDWMYTLINSMKQLANINFLKASGFGVLLLLLQDLWSWYNGIDSIIGRLISRMEGFKDSLSSIPTKFKNLFFKDEERALKGYFSPDKSYSGYGANSFSRSKEMYNRRFDQSLINNNNQTNNITVNLGNSKDLDSQSLMDKIKAGIPPIQYRNNLNEILNTAIIPEF